MLLTDSADIPVGDGWVYETKYDGYRCLLYWEKGKQVPDLISRNGRVINKSFPEIVRFCESISDDIQSYLPLMLDGEIVNLIND